MSDLVGGGAAFLGIFLVFAFLAIAIGAMVLRMACKLVGEVPPDFGKAMLIVLAAGFAQSLIGGVFTSIGLDYNAINLIVSAAVSSFVYSKMLPTDIGKAALIWLAQIVVCIILGIVIFVGVFVLGLGAGSMM
ncbi:MAG: hypothetical protein KC800_00105 [Candidatus Eremiobacteraeota bacterium]|nr:hypothetical protein [Candidatus Eremiobacteraeota bacterium]